ncbi:MAG: sporulation protein YqfD [Clostridia bacterium]|nr:sporulation protein YqfD [Clostridia bacterium]
MSGWDVQFTLTGLSSEKWLNEARKQGIRLKRVKRTAGRDLVIQCGAKDYAALSALARDKGYEVGEARPVGWLKRAATVKKRWGVALGGVVCAGLLIYALGFVWQVRIENAGPYEGTVRTFLQEKGIVPGIRRSQVRLGDLREQLEWYLPQVKWVRTSWQGVALRVSIDEGTPPPDIETAGAAGNVVAGEDGILTRLTTYAGTPKAKSGDFVRAGQLLIEGVERGPNEEATPVKARGEAVARVWETVRVRMPLTAIESTPTGRETLRRVLTVPFFAWSMQEEPDYLTADREVSCTVIGGVWVPIVLQRERYIEAALETKARDTEEVAREAEGAALRLLNERLRMTETVDKWINFRMIEGDTIIVEAAGEMIRDIGRLQKNDP